MSKRIGCGIAAILVCGVALAQTYQPGIVPNAKTQFTDANGAPLAGGKVYFYVPGTTTPTNTYQDPNDSILNSNPVRLDSAGRAIIWGTGQFREVVYDNRGNLVWDQITSQTNLSSSGCPDENVNDFQFSNNINSQFVCTGASALTTFDQGASININAVQPNIQGVGGLNLLAGTTGSNYVNLTAGNGSGSGTGATAVFDGGSVNNGGNIILTAGNGGSASEAGEIELTSLNQIIDTTTCTEINQDGIGSGGVPTSRIYIQAGSSNVGCSATGAGVIEFNGQVQFDSSWGQNTLFVDNPSNGSTVTIPDNYSFMELIPSGTLSTLTVHIPTCSATYNNKMASWSTTQTISTVTLAATAGTIVSYAVGTINAFGGMQFICRGSNSTWYQVSYASTNP